jgi:putative phosphoribosyl transferase
MMRLPYKDRIEAGRLLATALKHYGGRTDVLVLALPRGGVPVAAEVAKELGVTLDLMLVRKLGTPGHEELAMGAIATGGSQVLNEDLIRHLDISSDVIEAVAQKERRELRRREQAYRGGHPVPAMRERCVILIDDGVATGATMRAAVAALRQQDPARIVIAVPVAPPETIADFQKRVDEVVCLATPTPFLGVGRWYQDFSQTSDAEVRALLAEAWGRPGDTQA